MVLMTDCLLDFTLSAQASGYPVIHTLDKHRISVSFLFRAHRWCPLSHPGFEPGLLRNWTSCVITILLTLSGLNRINGSILFTHCLHWQLTGPDSFERRHRNGPVDTNRQGDSVVMIPYTHTHTSHLWRTGFKPPVWWLISITDEAQMRA